MTRLNTMQIDNLAKAIYEQNKVVGWWDDPNRCVYQTLQLVSTEVAEATEGERKNLMDDHLPNRKMGEVELADALIRVLDLGGRYDFTYVETVEPCKLFNTVGSIGGRHFLINVALVDLFDATVIKAHRAQVDKSYSKLIKSIVKVARQEGYDIFGALEEKRAYNKTRADHKRENRAKGHGKKF